MKDKIIVISFLAVVYAFFLLNIFVRDADISLEERRHLKQFPNVTVESILNGSFMDEFEDYTLDQFPFGKEFRNIKANTNYHIFKKLENDGLFVKDEKIFKQEYPLDEKSISNFTNKILHIKEKYLRNNDIYYAIIPDKNYYLEDSGYLKMDYDLLYENVMESFKDFKYIELRNNLSLDKYYNTDTHWRQEYLVSISNIFKSSMIPNFIEKDIKYKTDTYEPFYGVFYGQSALKFKPDSIKYLSNDFIDNAKVYDYIKDEWSEVYKKSSLGGMDSYDVFLSGAVPLIKIENNMNTEGRELVIFRDSFASSLTPLLIDEYSSITLIDLRYISENKLSDYLSFENKDILFIYSTLIINQSFTLK